MSVFSEFVAKAAGRAATIRRLLEQLAKSEKSRELRLQVVIEQFDELHRLDLEVKRLQELVNRQSELLRECDNLLVAHHDSSVCSFNGACPVCSYGQTQVYPNNIFVRLHEIEKENKQ